MKSTKWIKIFFFVSSLSLFLIASINYIVDPYDIYGTKYIKLDKITKFYKTRLVKTIMVREIKPSSIILGTSRAQFGYDPTHPYFIQPSYNLAIASGSMYENRLNFELALAQGNLKKVLLVLDYRMFNYTQRSIPDFDSYFKHNTKYKYLFSIDTLKDSFHTIKGTTDYYRIELNNGQNHHTNKQKEIDKMGGHLNIMKLHESKYYKNYSIDNTYIDTKNKSFLDLEKVIALCYKNNITLDIIFGPSHIHQWEALNYYLGYNSWLQWKKNIIISCNKVSKRYNKNQFRIIDFSIYHNITAEKIPKDKNKRMKYYWDSGHYKNALGNIVLDRLLGKRKYQNFGIELNSTNIDKHLDAQKLKRIKFIDIVKYQNEFKKFLLQTKEK